MKRHEHRLLVFFFVAGLVMKVLHLPYHTIWLILVAISGIVASGLELRRSRDGALARLASWCWALHLVAVLKLFPFTPVTLGIALVITTWATISYWRRRDLSRPVSALLGVFILMMTIMARPRSERYYATNLALSIERDRDVASWDKYSFLLLHDGETKAALGANEQATEVARSSGSESLIPALTEHAEAIANEDWPVYTPLSHDHDEGR